jgi:hypothetical protein
MDSSRFATFDNSIEVRLNKSENEVYDGKILLSYITPVLNNQKQDNIKQSEKKKFKEL